MLVLKYMRRGKVVPLRKMRKLIGGITTPEYWRPKTRGECTNAPRPCPFVGCPYNVYLDVSQKTGSITFNFPAIPPERMDPTASCTLDVAERGPSTLDEIATVVNLTRERVRQIADGAIRKLKRHAHLFLLFLESGDE